MSNDAKINLNSDLADSARGATLQSLADGVQVLRFNRPARLNALDDNTVELVQELLRQVANDADCRVLIVTGVGRGFCAGFDLSLAADAPGSEFGETQAWMKRQENFSRLVTQLRDLRQPVIAAVNGPANGAGLGLALACDMRISASSAVFNAAFIRVGMSSCDIGVSYLLPRCVGMTRAFEIMLTGRMIDAQEADRIGLVSRVVPDDDLLPQAVALAQQIAANSSFAVWMTKRGMWANVEASSLQAAIELENRTQILARTTGELKAAAQAMLAKQGKPAEQRLQDI